MHEVCALLVSASVLARRSGSPRHRDTYKDIGGLPIYLWMWPFDELLTCPGCNPVLAPRAAGIGSSNPVTLSAGSSSDCNWLDGCFIPGYHQFKSLF